MRARQRLRSSRTWITVTAWLRASVRRSIVFPLVGLMLVLAVAGMFAGSRAVLALVNTSYTQALETASKAADRMLEAHLVLLDYVALQMAQREEVATLLQKDSPLVAAQLALEWSGVADMDVVALLDGPGSLRALWPRDEESELAWRARLATGSALNTWVRCLMASGCPEPAYVVGEVAGQEGPVLYLVRRVVRQGHVLGVLVLGVSLGDLLQSVAGWIERPLVFYDSDGFAVFASLPTDAEGLSGLRVAKVALNSATEAQPLAMDATLNRQRYHTVMRPVMPRGVNVGYLAIWQPVSEPLVQALRWQLLLILAIAVSFGLVMILSLWLAGYVTRPLTALAQAVGGMADNGQGRPLPETPIGELSALVKAFGRVTNQMQGQTEQLRRQARLSTYLFEASAELGRSLNLEESLQTAAEAIYGLEGVSYVVIMVGEGEVGPYTCRAVRGLPGEVASRIQGREYQVPLWGVMARALVSRQPLIINDVVAEKRPRPGEFEWEVGGSLLLFPVVSGNEPCALIIVGTEEPQRFSVDGLGDVVFALARIAGHSILNARLYEEASRYQEQLVTLQMLSRLVASAASVKDVLDVVLREASELMGYSTTWLYLQDPATGTRELHGRQGAGAGEQWAPVHQDAVTWVMRAGQPIFYDPEQPLPPSPILNVSGPAICVPLEVNENPLGALVVVSPDHQRKFFEDDMVVLRTLANSAAAALQTAQRAEQLRA